ncbi:class I SAM-dependent methyltransferase [Agrobacterium larrymoorei]|uniref:Cyclopropane fatty-acyl-phospholipid synthase-like methyltransferase n=1 Tax=Agrobacterium larrymoorei TaxID=160699 RepID=A0ABU0UPE4_9HYPH|nr:class I SAM-dependent methyltransferase [Agrobacterium larrymoorei]MDQ1186726.1 cyclopropane fatty-acyl-phospholipid synthase-like methyltransferase [Agrobacterium larrymoorei]
MTARDDETIDFYAREVAAYTTRGQEASPRLEAFLAALPPGGRILELGCGAGQDSEAMLARGFDVHPTDGTPEMARAAAERLGVATSTLLFEDINAQSAYDGIWANACLLHVPRATLPSIIARIHAAMRDKGVFYASYKAGKAEGRDDMDRFYNYPSSDWLLGVYQRLPWTSVTIDEAEGGGYDNKPTDWLHVTALKP